GHGVPVDVHHHRRPVPQVLDDGLAGAAVGAPVVGQVEALIVDGGEAFILQALGESLAHLVDAAPALGGFLPVGADIGFGIVGVDDEDLAPVRGPAPAHEDVQ